MNIKGGLLIIISYYFNIHLVMLYFHYYMGKYRTASVILKVFTSY